MKKLILVLPLFIISGCAGFLPDVSHVVETVEDKAICIEIKKEAFKDTTNVKIGVDVTNKYPTTP